MQPASELSVIPHLHVDALIQTEPDEIEGLLDGICCLLLQTKPKQSELLTQERPANSFTAHSASRRSETLPQIPASTQKQTTRTAERRHADTAPALSSSPRRLTAPPGRPQRRRSPREKRGSAHLIHLVRHLSNRFPRSLARLYGPASSLPRGAGLLAAMARKRKSSVVREPPGKRRPGGAEARREREEEREEGECGTPGFCA